MFPRAAFRLGAPAVRRGGVGARAAPKRGFAGWNYGGEYKKAYLFGEKPGTPWEGWEPIVYFFYPLSAIILIVGLGFKPRTSIKDWAYEEAMVRLKREANGEEVKYGVHYQNHQHEFTKEATGELTELSTPMMVIPPAHVSQRGFDPKNQ